MGLLIAGVAWVRHPTTFPRYESGFAMKPGKPGGLSDPTVTTLRYFLCTTNVGRRHGVLLMGPFSFTRTVCGAMAPADGLTMQLSDQQLIVAVTPHRVGTMLLRGLDVSYRHGWQDGTQRVGGDVQIQVVR